MVDVGAVGAAVVVMSGCIDLLGADCRKKTSVLRDPFRGRHSDLVGDRPLPLHLPFSPGLLVLVGAADADGCDEGGGRVRASCGRQDGVTGVATLRLLLVHDVGALSPSK